MTISRGRKGVKIFTADKFQLRQNIARSGNRTLAMDMKPSAFQKLATIWGRDMAFVLNVKQSQRQSAKQQAEALRQLESLEQSQAMKPAETIRRRIEIQPAQNQQQSRGMKI